MHTLSTCQVPSEYRKPFISHGYRPQLNHKEAIASCFCIHNETLNIWTAIVGLVWWIGVIYSLVAHLEQGVATGFQKFYIISAALSHSYGTFIPSALAHIFQCTSIQAWDFWFRLDWAGVAFAMIGWAAGYSAVSFKWQYLPMFFYLVPILYCNIQALRAIATVPSTNYKTICEKWFAKAVIWAFSLNLYNLWMQPMHLQQAAWYGVISVGWIVLGFIVKLFCFPEKIIPTNCRWSQFVILSAYSHVLFHICVFLSTISWGQGMIHFISHM